MKKLLLSLTISFTSLASAAYASTDQNTNQKKQLAESTYSHCVDQSAVDNQNDQAIYKEFLKKRYARFINQDKNVADIVTQLEKQHLQALKNLSVYAESLYVNYMIKNVSLSDLQTMNQSCLSEGSQLLSRKNMQARQYALPLYAARYQQLMTQLFKQEQSEMKNYLNNSFASKYNQLNKVDDINTFADLVYQATTENNPNAAYQLSMIYQDGNYGIHKNPKAAFYWVKIAAKHKVPGAANNMAIFYDEGIGIKQDNKKAHEYFLQAAEQGDRMAMYNLGLNYFRPKDGTQPDYKNALVWYQKAASQGVSCAMHDLGLMYLNGNGVSADKEKAREWFTKMVPAAINDSTVSLDTLSTDFSDDLPTLSRYYAQYMTSDNKKLPIFKNARQINQDMEKACWN